VGNQNSCEDPHSFGKGQAMGKVFVVLNTEYSRSSDKPFEWAVEHAAKMGYKYFEPMVHYGRELMSEAGYFHTFRCSMIPIASRVHATRRRQRLSLLPVQAPATLGYGG
jgi:hypothetical protein